eukprot:5327156-Amphidinium_carterae.2
MMTMVIVMTPDMVFKNTIARTPWTRGEARLRDMVNSHSDPPDRPTCERWWGRGIIHRAVRRTCGGRRTSLCSSEGDRSSRGADC